MRASKFLASCLIVLLASGCACHKRGSGGNVPLAEPGRELKDVNFAFDSYALDATAKAVLDANAAWLKSNTGRKVQVEGHCDERGTNEYNMVLGMNRARSTFDYMRGQGIDQNTMSTVSYGEDLPLNPAHNEAAWAQNRRSHFNLQ